MGLFRSNGNHVPAAIEKMASDVKAGQMDRREFLALASTFGASAAMAYGLIGVALPQPARAAEPKKGGTLRVSMPVNLATLFAVARVQSSGVARIRAIVLILL